MGSNLAAMKATASCTNHLHVESSIASSHYSEENDGASSSCGGDDETAVEMTDSEKSAILKNYVKKRNRSRARVRTTRI